MSEPDPLAGHDVDLNALAIELIERTGLSRYQIAQQTTISESALSNVASGKRRPSIEMLCTLANLAGVKIKICLTD